MEISIAYGPYTFAFTKSLPVLAQRFAARSTHRHPSKRLSRWSWPLIPWTFDCCHCEGLKVLIATKSWSSFIYVSQTAWKFGMDQWMMVKVVILKRSESIFIHKKKVSKRFIYARCICDSHFLHFVCGQHWVFPAENGRYVVPCQPTLAWEKNPATAEVKVNMVFDSCGTIHWKFLQSIWNIFLRPAATWVSGTFFFWGVMLGHGRGSITFISGIYMVDTWILSLEKGSPTGDFCGNLSADRWEVRDIFGYVIQVLACDKKRCCSWNAIYGSSRRARGRADNDIACRWAGDGGKWKRDIGLPWIWMICCQCFVFKNFLLDS